MNAVSGRFLTFFCYFRNKRKIGDISIIRKVFFVRRGVLRRGLMRNDLRGEGKVPVRMDRLTIERTVEIFR